MAEGNPGHQLQPDVLRLLRTLQQQPEVVQQLTAAVEALSTTPHAQQSRGTVPAVPTSSRRTTTEQELQQQLAAAQEEIRFLRETGAAAAIKHQQALAEQERRHILECAATNFSRVITGQQQPSTAAVVRIGEGSSTTHRADEPHHYSAGKGGSKPPVVQVSRGTDPMPSSSAVTPAAAAGADQRASRKRLYATVEDEEDLVITTGPSSSFAVQPPRILSVSASMARYHQSHHSHDPRQQQQQQQRSQHSSTSQTIPMTSTSPAPVTSGRSAAAGRRAHLTPRTPSETYAERLIRAKQQQQQQQPPQSSASVATMMFHPHTSHSGSGLEQHVPYPVPPPLTATATTTATTTSPQPHSVSAGAVPGSRQAAPVGGSSGLCVLSSRSRTGATRSPSPVNPQRGPIQPRRFVFTGLGEAEVRELQAAVDAIGQDARVLLCPYDAPPPLETTHVVVRGTPKSVKAMCAVVSGRWLVAPEYILRSRDVGFWLDEVEEGGLHIYPPPLRGVRFLMTKMNAMIAEKLREVILYGEGEVEEPGVSGDGYDPGVMVVSCGDDLLRYATQQQ